MLNAIKTLNLNMWHVLEIIEILRIQFIWIVNHKYWASLVAQLVKNPPTGDPSMIPRSGEGIGYPLQYSSASLLAQMVKNPPASSRDNLNFKNSVYLNS